MAYNMSNSGRGFSCIRQIPRINHALCAPAHVTGGFFKAIRRFLYGFCRFVYVVHNRPHLIASISLRPKGPSGLTSRPLSEVM